MDVEPFGLITGEAVGNRLEGGAHGIEMIEPLAQTKVIEVVGDQLVAQEGRELLVLLEEGALEVGAEDVMAVLDLVDDRGQLAAHAAVEPHAEDAAILSAPSRHRPSSQLRSNSLWMGKWRLKMKLRQYSTCAMA